MTGEDSVVSRYGVRMPRIIYGTAWKKDRTADLVEQAIKLGFRGIDTACQPKHYDERGVGEGLRRCLGSVISRQDLYLQTKFTPLNGHDPARIPYDPRAPIAQQVAQSFAASLGNLEIDYLDCLILHSPLPDERQSLAAWQAMEDLFEAGGARQLGISNCYEPGQFESLCRKARIKPAVLQNRFYAETGYDRELRQFCRENEIRYQSFWTLTANPGILADEAMTTLAANHARSPAQVFFRYLIENDIIPLTGTTSPVHMREDLAVFQFGLSQDERDAVTRLLYMD